MATRPKIVITYCAECGYEDATLELAGALMKEFGNRLDCVELVPWEEGTFEVAVAGELVHSMTREGGFADHERVKAAVREKLGA